MKIIVYLCLTGILFTACNEENKKRNSKNDFSLQEPIHFLSRRYYCFNLKLSTGNLEKAVSNDHDLYDVLGITRKFKDIGDFEGIQNKLLQDSVLVLRNLKEDKLLQRFVVDKGEKCSVELYEKSLIENKTLELTGLEITNCLIYKFCKKGYYVAQSDESGNYFIKEK